MGSLTSLQAALLQAKRTTKGRRSPRRLFIVAQQRLMIHIQSDKTSPADLAKCVCALEKAEERLRILNKTPLPGQLRPDWPKPKEKGKQRATPLPLPEVDEREEPKAINAPPA